MTVTTPPSAALQLAEKVVLDIRARGLGPGDRYLTSEEARGVFRVRKSLINSAMKILAEKEILVRQRKAGTFIGPQFKADPLVGHMTLTNIHVMMSLDYYRARVVPADMFVDGIGKVMPHVTVQMHYVPDHRAYEHTRTVVEEIGTSATDKNAHGLILIRSPREAQRFVEDSGVPAVVFGSIYPDVKRLPCVDLDQEQAGRLGARHALSLGHKRFLLVNRNEWRRGDNLALQGVTRELAAAGLGMDALQVASIPPQADVIREEIRSRLYGTDRPSALLCRGAFIADPVLDLLTELGHAPGDKSEYDIVDMQRNDRAGARCPSVCPVIDQFEQIGELARILASLSDGQPLARREMRISAELYEPNGKVNGNGHLKH